MLWKCKKCYGIVKNDVVILILFEMRLNQKNGKITKQPEPYKLNMLMEHFLMVFEYSFL